MLCLDVLADIVRAISLPGSLGDSTAPTYDERISAEDFCAERRVLGTNEDVLHAAYQDNFASN
jgi:hypothetical protein